MTRIGRFFWTRFALVLVLLLVPVELGISAGLDFGPHAVGFRLLSETDSSRAFPSTDLTGLRARPVRVYLWYPADEPAGPGMKLGDFVKMAADDFRLSEGPSPSGAAGLTVPLSKGLDQPQLQALLETSLTAVLDAKPERGTFPLLVLGQGLYYESPLSHVALCEYLASRGYIVATCPLLGTQYRLVNLSVEDLETQIRDMEFAMATVWSRSPLHTGPLGVIGYDMGGMAGLVMCMRNPQVVAFLSMDSGILTRHFSGLPNNHPQYREDRFTVPWMHMTQGRFLELELKEPSMLANRKPFGDTLLVGVPTESHGQFSSYGWFGIRKEVPGYWAAIENDPRALHDEICRLAGMFFDAYLKKDTQATEHLRATRVGSLSIETRKGASPPPSSASLLNLIIERGVTEARPDIDRVRSANPGSKILEEDPVNWLGYHFLLWWGREKEALDVFQLNVDLNPGSANAYDSLGEALLFFGRTDEAIAAYRKSLELNPENQNAASVLERLTKKQ